MNLYAYVANAPGDYIDPSGMSLVPGAFPEYCRDPLAISMTPELSGRKGVIAQVVAAELAFLGLVGRVLDCSIGTPGMVSGGGALLARAVEGRGAITLSRDATGKIHGALSRTEQLKDAPIRTVRENIGELRGSILVRKQELARLGEHGPHRARIAHEETLLRSLEKHLENLFGAKSAR